MLFLISNYFLMRYIRLGNQQQLLLLTTDEAYIIQTYFVWVNILPL